MPRSKKSNPWNYEETIAQVEAIIEQIESGTLPLENVFEQFATAVKHLHQCEDFLMQGKQRMELLIETLEPEQDIDF